MGDYRAERLKKFLNNHLRDPKKTPLQNDGAFIEALCLQPDPVDCITRVIGASALPSLAQAMRFDLSDRFLNGLAADLLAYLQHDQLYTINNGLYLQNVVLAISKPAPFFHALRDAFLKGQLQEQAQVGFGWLLHQLIRLSDSDNEEFRQQVDSILLAKFAGSPFSSVRLRGEDIRKHLDTLSTPSAKEGPQGPGGRHDNDKADFRDIAVRPTADEVSSTAKAFIRPANCINTLPMDYKGFITWIDNQFRLLREDMLYDLKEELSKATKKGRRGFSIQGLSIDSIQVPNKKQAVQWYLALVATSDLPQFKGIKDPKERKKLLLDNRKLLSHGSLACLRVNDRIVALPTIVRDEDLLTRSPPVIVICLEGEETTANTFLKLKTASPDQVQLTSVDTAVFSYEPVLKALQTQHTLRLAYQLMGWSDEEDDRAPWPALLDLEKVLLLRPTQDVRPLLRLTKQNPIILDSSQLAALRSGLTQRVALIQGPPGTGKSFVGSLITKAIHDMDEPGIHILVICYTNHALDQFLEDLMDIGIPGENIVRLGRKGNGKTDHLSLANQKSSYKLNRADWSIIDANRQDGATYQSSLLSAFQRYKNSRPSTSSIMAYLEFDEREYFEAFRVEASPDDMTRIGKNKRKVDELYLLDSWIKGWDPRPCENQMNVRAARGIWEMKVPERQALFARWTEAVIKEDIVQMAELGSKFNRSQAMVDEVFRQSDGDVLRQKRIIACTTTGAAKYIDLIQSSAKPDIVVVEEAGEILESHILTALSSNTRQLILIGDHKQLRPKVQNYELTVEKEQGYDLNRSMFERLVLSNYPHETLLQQHRMRPEISSLVRTLTYPDLRDAPSTHNRDHIRGLQSDIVFIRHTHPEGSFNEVGDRRDLNSTSSKHNYHEVEMVLRIVRYLGQQGYGTEDLVVLTPYLGQLYKLFAALKKSTDPVLNDLDSHDLVKAGLIPEATAKLTRKPLRISTIDNYQGEESNIVIISLTRSNSRGDIGFMFAPERLNVLLSRARIGLIMLGNDNTFTRSRKGGELWGRLFGLLGQQSAAFDGLPVKCERHPDRKAILKSPADFDTHSPEGGCLEPCGAMLQCGKHTCPSSCHQLSDHSKLPCPIVMKDKCSSGHDLSWKCSNGRPAVCSKCKRELDRQLKEQAKAIEQQKKRDAEREAHDREMEDLDAQIRAAQQDILDRQEAENRLNAVRQKQADLADMTSRHRSSLSVPPLPTPTQNLPKIDPAQLNEAKFDTQGPIPPRNTPANVQAKAPSPNTNDEPDETEQLSPSELRWDQQKKFDGAQNRHLDDIMALTGLETVKEQVMNIKAKIDTASRQGVSLKEERLHVAMLGNPGTGKTTIARLYAKFLFSVNVLPGPQFIETTGSRLASDGLPGTKKQIDELVKSGGGAVFIDEAYQLTTDPQGKQCLDFILAEIENNVGKVVFIFAGYKKEMESFFEHNPGIPSRVPYQLLFEDSTDSQLLSMLRNKITKKYSGNMKVEDGMKGLYMRIAVRRLGRGRGKEGFGNARALENLLVRIGERQARRLELERRAGQRPDDFSFVKEDLIGPEPSQALIQSAAYKQLNAMIGLASVKARVVSLLNTLTQNYQRELQELEPVATSLNKVFTGSPGTGKTTVAKLYGKILAEIGLLSKGEVVVKNPADFIGSVLGESEQKTKGILASSMGKVLLIDEAYMMYSAGAKGDIYRTAVIDTLVAEVQNVPGEDRCILLAGYKKEMEEMFQNVNPGLARRFDMENAFFFEDFKDDELRQILDMKLKGQNLDATEKAKHVAIDVLSRERRRPNFGNAGAVDNILSRAKGRYMERDSSSLGANITFEPQDFDPDFARADSAGTNLDELFKDMIGCDDVKGKLQEYGKLAQLQRLRNQDPYKLVPTTFVFKGPPGTGKTTIARKIGQAFYNMGFLQSGEVHDCSAKDLVGEYVGQTAPKVAQLFEKALGRVLFIDEAYRLGEGHFAKEAMDEIVDLVTKEQFQGKIVVIIAGYEKEMNTLLSVNSGLSSRFPTEFIFPNMPASHCAQVLFAELDKENISYPDLKDPNGPHHTEMIRLFDYLASLPSWGNARDVKTLAQRLIRNVMIEAADPCALVASGDEMIRHLEEMYKEKKNRAVSPTFASDMLSPPPPVPLPPTAPPPTSTPPSINTATAAPRVEKARPPTPPPEPKEENQKETSSSADPTRDPGVSDAVWEALQAAKRAAERQEAENERLIQELSDKAKEAAKTLVDAGKAEEAVLAGESKKTNGAASASAKKPATDNRVDEERKKKLEQARIAALKARAEKRRLEEELKKKKEAEERRKKEEAKVQSKLREMGVCPVGYRWIKMSGGYRCAGGSHFVGNAQLGM